MTDLTSLPHWDQAVASLEALNAAHGAEAAQRARKFGELYAGRRAPMVIDVAASARADYLRDIQPTVLQFESDHPDATLASLATTDLSRYSKLRGHRPEAIRGVAAGLDRYCQDHDLDDESGVRSWAATTGGYAHASNAEPYVGDVKGIGTALFAYLRMRCGADAIKPDKRVQQGLNRLGLKVPYEPHTILVVADALAQELGLSLLILDQLMWWNPYRFVRPSSR